MGVNSWDLDERGYALCCVCRKNFLSFHPEGTNVLERLF